MILSMTAVLFSPKIEPFVGKPKSQTEHMAGCICGVCLLPESLLAGITTHLHNASITADPTWSRRESH